MATRVSQEDLSERLDILRSSTYFYCFDSSSWHKYHVIIFSTEILRVFLWKHLESNCILRNSCYHLLSVWFREMITSLFKVSLLTQQLRVLYFFEWQPFSCLSFTINLFMAPAPRPGLNPFLDFMLDISLPFQNVKTGHIQLYRHWLAYPCLLIWEESSLRGKSLRFLRAVLGTTPSLSFSLPQIFNLYNAILTLFLVLS